MGSTRNLRGSWNPGAPPSTELISAFLPARYLKRPRTGEHAMLESLSIPTHSPTIAAFELVIFRLGDSLLADGEVGQSIGDEGE